MNINVRVSKHVFIIWVAIKPIELAFRHLNLNNSKGINKDYFLFGQFVCV